MIAALQGTLLARDATGVVIMTPGGVGYQVFVSQTTLDALPGAGEPAFVFTHLSLREDAQELFGFASEGEREAFRLLISVSKVGPRLALSLLSTLGVAELAAAIREGTVRRLAAAPGVGKKMAERIALELRDKVALLPATPAAPGAPAAPTSDARAAVLRDLHSALLNLGYRLAVVEATVQKVEAELVPDGAVPTLKVLLPKALQHLR